MGKKYQWIRLKDDFFRDPYVKKMKREENGDTLIIIYLELLLLSLQDDGRLYFSGVEDTFSEEMALVLDESPDDVRECLTFLEKHNLITEVENDVYELSTIHTLIGGESESAERTRQYRQRTRETSQCDGDVTDCDGDVTVCDASVTDCDGDVTNCDVEKSKRREDIEKNKSKSREDKEKDKKTYSSSNDDECCTDVRQVVATWNSLESLGIPKITKIVSGTQRYQKLTARIKQYGMDSVLQAIENVRHSDFLQGKNNKGWVITFDWFILPNNFPKVLDGNYNQNHNPPNPAEEKERESHIMMAEWAIEAERKRENDGAGI